MDGSVIVAAYSEGASCEILALCECCLSALLVEDVEEHSVFSLAWHDNHVVEVLCSSTYERDAADIDFFDDVCLRGSACHGVLEWVKVNDDEVDFWYFVLCHLFLVAVVLTSSEYSSEHLWVKCLHTSAEYGRIGGDVFHLLALVSERLDKLLCTSCRKELNTLFVELLEQLIQTIFVENRDQCGFYLFLISHFVDYITLYEYYLLIVVFGCKGTYFSCNGKTYAPNFIFLYSFLILRHFFLPPWIFFLVSDEGFALPL